MITKRDKKGKCLALTPRDYCVVSLKTTGLTPSDGEIIRLSAVRYRDLVKTDSFTTLVKPKMAISEMTVRLTGITNEMVADAPDISPVISDFYSFVQDDIIIGYNLSFDINYLYDALLECHGIALSNDYIDVMTMSRKALPRFDRRSQSRIADHIYISTNSFQQPEKDCEVCNAIYRKLMNNSRITKWVEENNRDEK